MLTTFRVVKERKKWYSACEPPSYTFIQHSAQITFITFYAVFHSLSLHEHQHYYNQSQLITVLTAERLTVLTAYHIVTYD